MRLLRGIEAAAAALSRRSVQPWQEAVGLGVGIRRVFGEDIGVEEAVARIVEDVRRRGDVALFEYARRIDGVSLTSLEVTEEESVRASREVSPELAAALKQAADRVYAFHLSQRGKLGLRQVQQGAAVLVRPLDRVGAYVPGGRACYPSTVLMTVLPARAAGVGEVVVCTPPAKDGRVPAPTLAAARIAGASRVFKMGGAQAIAAMAFGTASVPGVDKVCGPGNVFVTLAKRMVYGVVDVDGLQGPSELVVVADDSSDPAYCAADLLAQGEHDPMASAVLVTTSERMASAVEAEIERQAGLLSRAGIVAESVVHNGTVAVVNSVDEAVELVNRYAPEHVSLSVSEPDRYLSGIRNAGCVFMGRECAPALGDFVAGPSHVLPTGGTARFGSPLTVSAFLKSTSVVSAEGVALREAGRAACTIAKAEGFDAHCRSVEMRIAGDGR